MIHNRSDVHNLLTGSHLLVRSNNRLNQCPLPKRASFLKVTNSELFSHNTNFLRTTWFLIRASTVKFHPMSNQPPIKIGEFPGKYSRSVQPGEKNQITLPQI